MSLAFVLKPYANRRFDPRIVALVAALAVGLILALTGAPSRLHAPDLSLITHSSPAMRLHLTAALIALIMGARQLVAKKGGLAHRLIGWSWSLIMIAAAASSFFIQSVFKGHFSPIHLLSIYVLVQLPLAIQAARKGDLVRHAAVMRGMYWMGLVTAGLFTLVPGRLLHAVFFS